MTTINVGTVCQQNVIKGLNILIDTGASICAIKYECLVAGQHIIEDTITVNSASGNIKALGYIYLTFTINNLEFREKFYVFDNLNCHTEGIIGNNFLKKHRAVINYEHNTLTLDKLGQIVELQFDVGNGRNIQIPPRCEIIRHMKTVETEECMVIGAELCEGVFVGSTLATPREGKIPVKILNTRETEINLNSYQPHVVKLRDYEICSFSDSARERNADRVKELFSMLNLQGLNIEEQKEIEKVCAKYCDIFHLPNDGLGFTNIYQQKINLQDNVTPTYIKPYRLPQSQKAEIDKQIKDMLENDIIEPAISEWSSPLLIVPKKLDTGDKKWRVVIDYCQLNNKTKKI
jgi:hypothetical protein